MIQTHDLTLEYDDETAVKGINISVAKGQIVSVLGASGSGKSSLLGLIAGIKKPTSGTVKVDGQRLLKPRLNTSTILQDYGLLPWKTVCQNITFSFDAHGIKDLSHVDEFASRLGIKDYYQRYPHQLSGGQKQRVAITRALCLHSDLILMDEAFSALDFITKETLQDLLLQIHRESTQTIVFVTHSIEEAVYLGQKILIMKEGQVLKELDNPSFGNRESSASLEFIKEIREVLHD